MAIPTATNGKAQNGQAVQAAPVPRQPFVKAAKNHIELGQQQTITLSAAQQTLQPFVLPAYGYLRQMILVITGTTAGNVAAVTFNADGPWNIIRNMILQDSGGAQLFQLGGYAAKAQAKYGGYNFNGNLEADTRFFSAVTGAGATGGSFQIAIPINQCFMRDGVGALPNMDASSAYQLLITTDIIANVYGVAPTNAPSVSFQLVEMAYSNPPTMDIFKRPNMITPPGMGPEGSSVQYWSSNVTPVVLGTNTITLSRVGNNIRGHILIFRTAAGARSDLINSTAQIVFDWDGNNRYITQRNFLDLWTWWEYGYPTEVGVIPLMNVFDPDGRAGNELGQEYLQTVSGTRLQLRFDANAAGTIEVLTNDVVLPIYLR